jgi:hypothetical protein
LELEFHSRHRQEDLSPFDNENMGYEKIDRILDAWATAHRLNLCKVYQESEVRSVEKRRGRRQGFQIWIDKPDIEGLIGVHLWDFKRRGRRRDFLVPMIDLREYLEMIYQIAQTWEKP